MAVIENIKCDKCGRIKEETNHWLALSITSPGLIARTFESILAQRNSTLADFQHYCSQDCAIKVFQQWMQENLETKSTELTLV